jgi:hypothetical protein
MARSAACAKRRFGRLAILEFLPQRHESRALGVRQHSEDAHHRRQFGLLALFPTFLGVDEGIAGVDLADVVDQQHGDDAVDVDGRLRVLRHRRREQRDLPAVLRGVFVAREPEGSGLAGYALEPVQFEYEIDDLLHRAPLFQHVLVAQPVRPSRMCTQASLSIMVMRDA